ncbi:hypothetical protein SAMN05444722_0546 [Rhodovulum sp. ES.010]|uniref:hypothetical protein n=1 Tax=Rhodovulum sp. ES.010 TaxID=1882821 RepID=UPI000926EE34|nr:hypothetical protein [Rhodovulum sp. ES.010]SIO13171.1 hypothetical protein SAMN05444722_0546 [Rhodovulum sp. ES.010]
MSRALAFAACLALAPLPGAAQDFAGLDIGQSAAAFGTLGPPVSAGAANPGYMATLWHQPGGNQLSVTTDSAGRIVYMENFRGPAAPPSVGMGLRFGATTRGEVLALTGSGGMVFPGRGAQVATGAETVHFHTYGLTGRPGVLATFAFVGPSGAPPDGALLDSVILSDASYQSMIWGGPPVPTPGYAEIDMRF